MDIMGGSKVKKQKKSFLPLEVEDKCYILKKKLQKNGWWWGEGVVVTVNVVKIVKESIGDPSCREKQLTFADPGTALVALYFPCHLFMNNLCKADIIRPIL